MALVVLSFLVRFLKETATLGSENPERSGGSAIHERGDDAPKADPPKLLPNDAPAPKAARPLLACDLNCFLLIISRQYARRTVVPVFVEQGLPSANFVRLVCEGKIISNVGLCERNVR